MINLCNQIKKKQPQIVLAVLQQFSEALPKKLADKELTLHAKNARAYISHTATVIFLTVKGPLFS